MVGADDLDRDAVDLSAELLGGHLRRGDRALAAEVGIEAGLVVEDADLDHVVGHLRRRGQGQQAGQGECEKP
jgi:hypothetical protein